MPAVYRQITYQNEDIMRQSFKTSYLIIACAFLFTACAGIDINSDPTRAVMAKSAARILGYKMTEANPSISKPAIDMCTMLTTGDPTQAMIDAAIASATAYFSTDPLLAASFLDLLSLVKFQATGTNSIMIDPKLVQAAARGCLEGIQMYRVQHVSVAKH